MVIDGGKCTACSARSISSTAVLKEASGARLNDTVTAGNCARWLITSGDLVTLMSAMPLKRHLAGAAGLGRQIQVAERLQIRQALGLRNQHHAILIGLIENGGDDALAERIVERIVDGRRGDAVARRQLPVDLDVDAQPVVVQIAGDVGDRLDLPHARDELGHVLLERLLARTAQHELILIGRYHGVERQILLGLQVELDAGYSRDLVLQAQGDLLRGERAVVMRLQVDQKAAVVEGRVGAVDADVRGDRGHVGILQDRIGELRLTRRTWPRRTRSCRRR